MVYLISEIKKKKDRQDIKTRISVRKANKSAQAKRNLESKKAINRSATGRQESRDREKQRNMYCGMDPHRPGKAKLDSCMVDNPGDGKWFGEPGD